MTDITVETACNKDKAYIREDLIASGLYDDGSLDNKGNARVDSMARPICDIFEVIEDIYYYGDEQWPWHRPIQLFWRKCNGSQDAL